MNPIFLNSKEEASNQADEDHLLLTPPRALSEPRLPAEFDSNSLVGNLASEDPVIRKQGLAFAITVVPLLDEPQLRRVWQSAYPGLEISTPADLRLETFRLFEQIIQNCENDTRKSLQWLYNFSSFEAPLDRRRLLPVAVAKDSDSELSASQSQVSLLPLLDRLISISVQAHLEARNQFKKDRNAKSRVSTSDANLHHILEFTMKYLSLEDAQFFSEDLETITHRVCQLSGQTYTINRMQDVIDILEILSHHTFEQPELVYSEIRVLCSACSGVPTISDRSLSIVRRLAQQNPETIQSQLLSIISREGSGKSSFAVRGALQLYEQLISDNKEAIFSDISFDALVDSVKEASSHRQSPRIDLQILRLFVSLLASRHRNQIFQENWHVWIDMITAIICKRQNEASSHRLVDAANALSRESSLAGSQFQKERQRSGKPKNVVNAKDTLLEFLSSVFELLFSLNEEFEKLNDSKKSSILHIFAELDYRVAAALGTALPLALLRALKRGSSVAANLFDKILTIAGDSSCHIKARLLAYNLMFRVRCDTGFGLLVLPKSEGEDLAFVLGRASRSTQSARKDQDRLGDSDVAQDPATSIKRTPLWLYPDSIGLSVEPAHQNDQSLFDYKVSTSKKIDIVGLQRWVVLVTECVQNEENWELRSYALVHLGAQLANMELFRDAEAEVRNLRHALVLKMLQNGHRAPPSDTGLRKADVAICLLSILTALIPYHYLFPKSENDSLVKCFSECLGTADGTSRVCLKALSLCCVEMPRSLTPSLYPIMTGIARTTSQPTLAMHTLEFLLNVARLPDLCRNVSGEEFRILFGICAKYLESSRDDKEKLSNMRPVSDTMLSYRQSGKQPELTISPNIVNEMPQYISALTYHVMIHWFLTIKLSDRKKHASFIIKRLVYLDTLGNSTVEEQSLVLDDMMQRTVASDLGETGYPESFFCDEDGQITSSSFIVGKSIVTIDVGGSSGRSIITKRQASGTTHSIHYQYTLPLPRHHVPVETGIAPESNSAIGNINVLPAHIMMQLVSTVAPMNLASQPIPLDQNSEYVRRALTSFDRNNTVDGHRIGIIYIGKDHKEELEILSNCMVSEDFADFVNQMGTLCPLSDAAARTWGFDESTDGPAAYAWRDRISEIVYHIPTIMPTSPDTDPLCSFKKRHVGNDHVKIIFNESGHEFDINTFPSQFNSVHIVIAPATLLSHREEASKRMLNHFNTVQQMVSEIPISHSDGAQGDSANILSHHEASGEHDALLPDATRSKATYRTRFYKVQTFTAAGMANISPVSVSRVVSATVLPRFVRLLALNASLYTLVWWHVKDDPNSTSPYPSPWRERLRQISALRDRAARDHAASLAALEATEADEAAANDASPPQIRPRFSFTSALGFRGSEKKGVRLEEVMDKPVPDFENAATAGKDETLTEWLDFSRWTGA